jgi:hypothetical protein
MLTQLCPTGQKQLEFYSFCITKRDSTCSDCFQPFTNAKNILNLQIEARPVRWLERAKGQSLQALFSTLCWAHAHIRLSMKVQSYHLREAKLQELQAQCKTAAGNQPGSPSHGLHLADAEAQQLDMAPQNASIVWGYHQTPVQLWRGRSYSNFVRTRFRSSSTP